MAGQLALRLVEVPESMSIRTLDARRSSFLSLTFKEALEAFRARRVVSPEEWARLEREARERAFTATRLATDSLREHAFDELVRALAEGSTFADFASSLRTQEASLGVTPSDPAYLDTIFRTNMATAYTAGRLQQMQSPSVVRVQPYVQYRAVIDGRTTSVCRYLDGLVFDRRTDPGWSKYAPPNHYNCRSTIVTLPASRVSPSQVVRSDQIDARGQPVAPFDAAPTLALEA
jgi:SPP1 gp7 family putative phage head morphogenesis protein